MAGRVRLRACFTRSPLSEPMVLVFHTVTKFFILIFIENYDRNQTAIQSDLRRQNFSSMPYF